MFAKWIVSLVILSSVPVMARQIYDHYRLTLVFSQRSSHARITWQDVNPILHDYFCLETKATLFTKTNNLLIMDTPYLT